MREIRTSGSMSGDAETDHAALSRLTMAPRPSSTLLRTEWRSAMPFEGKEGAEERRERAVARDRAPEAPDAAIGRHRQAPRREKGNALRCTARTARTAVDGREHA